MFGLFENDRFTYVLLYNSSTWFGIFLYTWDGSLILYISLDTGYFQIKSRKSVYIFANSADPCEMPRTVAVHLGISCICGSRRGGGGCRGSGPP